MTARARLLGAILAVAVAICLGAIAAWPIYQSWWLLVPAGAALVLGCGLAAIAAKRHWSGLVALALLFGLFVLTVAPVAVPSSLAQLPLGPLRGIVDGLAAIVLGWKQLLTLTLPVGTYQTMMVPAYLVFLLSAFLAVWIAVRGGRFAALAAFPMLAPVAFGTVFGSSAVSAPLLLGPLTVAAPREVGLWVAAALLGVLWVAFAAGAERRAALRLGRAGSGVAARGGTTRVLVGAATLVVAILATVLLTPVLDGALGGAREVPRDRIDPELIVREQASPLAGYRVSKTDERIDTPILEVTSDGDLPGRMRIAVLDDYDGVDFHVGAGEAGRFARFPSGDRVEDPTQVTVRIDEGYQGIWVPAAQLGSPPSFSGPRAGELSDAFYVNRRTGAAIAVPGGAGTTGLAEGDAYQAIMSAAPDGQLTGSAGSTQRSFDPDVFPELIDWIEAQDQPATGEGVTELIQRLRDRGYLSHSISDDEGRRLWLERLAERYGTRFESSAGGHSVARIEQLFAQLNTQQRLAGEEANPEMLVAAIGDDEQFAAAAAVVARAVGFDSRVVVGVRLGGDEAGVPGVPACEESCTGENLAAWVEVRGADGEWVPLDVTPQVETPPVSLEEGEQLPEFPTTPEERDAREVDPPIGLGEQNDQAEEPGEDVVADWLWPVLRTAGLSVSALALLALPLLFLPFAKRRRSKKRRAQADPELRALGAWQEMVDRAADAGVAVPQGAGRSEIAEALGTAPARWAAEQVDRAVFSPTGI
ncbi:MAG: DUF3488 domain-containing protein, partial [Leucobacter sp.]